MSRLILVRHAQASFGGADYDQLSSRGEEQARRLGTHWAEQRLILDRVFIGPRKRHGRTAEIVGATMRAHGLPWPEMLTLPEADEYAGLEVFRRGLAPSTGSGPASAGSVPGSSIQTDADASLALLKSFQGVIGRWVRGHLHVPGVETWKEFRARARRGLETMLAASTAGQQLAVFTSTGPVAAGLDLAFGLDDERFMEVSWQVRNTAVSEFLFSDSRFTLSVFNAWPHLPPGELVTRI